MTTPHKWAEVIHAFAEGKEIQWKSNSPVSLCREWTDSVTLVGIDYDNLNWRIKPEKKSYWVNVYKYNKHDVRMGTCIFRSEKEAKDYISDINEYIKTISFDIEE